MKNPTSKQVQVVIDNFEKVLPMANYENHLDMEKGAASCGSPMCHGAWYAVSCVTGVWKSFSGGADAMAKHLGFDFYGCLKDWASDNPEIWGNQWGADMFSYRCAFGDNCNSLQDIVNHWKGVRDRLRALEESQGVFLWIKQDEFTRHTKEQFRDLKTAPTPCEYYDERPEPKKPVVEFEVFEVSLN